MILLAVDPGRTTGWAFFSGEKLVAFGQFAVNDDTFILVRLSDIIEGKDGYPGNRFQLRPALAIVEEHSAQYHTSNARRGAGEGCLRESMKVNIACRRRVEAALLKLGVPSLGVTAEEWGARENVATAARAELELAGIALPADFNRDAREHERDAIALGGRCARRRVWEVK